MADSSIPITGGSGYNVDTRTQTGGDHRQVVTLGDSTSANSSTVNPGGDLLASLTSPNVAARGTTAIVTGKGQLEVNYDAATLFIDAFATSTVDANKWSYGGTVNPVQSVGAMSVSAGTTTSASSILFSAPTFAPAGLGWNEIGYVVTLDPTMTSTPNSHRFWGLGQQTSTYAATTPLSDGVGFEIALDGSLQCVTYVGGTKYVINSTVAANVSSSVIGIPGTGTATPAGAVSTNYGALLSWQGNSHRYAMVFRPDAVYWYVDDTTTAVAAANYLIPNVSTLPLRAASINATSGTIASTTFTLKGVAVGLSTHDTNTISDATYPWRRASVGKFGGLSIKGASITGQLVPFAAAATGIAGPVDVSEAGNVTFIIKNSSAAVPFTGNPVIVFEQSDDNVSWAALSVVRSDTLQVASTITLYGSAANAEIMCDAALEGVAWVRARVTTGTTTNGMAISVSPGGLAFSPSVALQQPARGVVGYYTLVPIATTVNDTLINLYGTKNGSTITPTITPATVTLGKTFRVTSFTVNYVATTVTGYAMVRLRAQAGGVVTTTSPVYKSLAVGASTPSTANSSGVATVVEFPDGLDFPAGTGLGISIQGFAGVTGTAVGYVQAEFTGYEY